jgi:diguanylate cyclase (GGDEF)-like protein/PAS domain S-box-containing protein
MDPFDLQRDRLPATVAADMRAPLPEASQARSLMDQSQSGLFVIGADGAICYVNAAVVTLLGWPAYQLVGQPHAKLMAPEFRDHAEVAFRRRLAGQAGRPGEVRCLRRDGSTVDTRVLARQVVFDGAPAVLVTLLDISELKDALRRAEWNASMLTRTEALCRAGSFEMAWPSGALRLSAGLASLLALPEDAPRDSTIDELPWVPVEERAYVAGIWRNAVVGEAFEFQHRVDSADGRRLVVLHRGQLGDDHRGVALLQDITTQIEAAQRIQELATHHEVTGLPNRAWLLDQLDAAIHAARWESRGFALLAIDLPRIAEVKANMGFGAGDSLCMALAARLRQQVHDKDTVAQLGDTEFAVMFEHGVNADQQALLARAHELQQVLQAPVRLGSTDVHALCVIGIATFPGECDQPERLLESAQTARLDVSGGQGIAFFRPESTTRALRSMSIESALWQALKCNEFELHYQPQLDLASGRISGAEALLRWCSPELGQVSPGEFIPVAERCGLIGAIGDWVLEQACRQVGTWRRAGLPVVRISVNLASAQLQKPDLARQIERLMLQTGADPAWLGVELTESMVMTDLDSAAAVLRAIKATGVQISLDDFGTGFSSLSYLSRLPLDVVKVDRSFVRDVTADAQDVSVTRAIISMTHGLQMRALAEGVETDGQLSLLVAAGCDEVQGFWFSPAVPAPDFEVLVRTGKCLPERYVRHPGGQRQRTLLLVDDEENILAALKRLLRREGYRILVAGSAAEGLQRLAEDEVDVIVSDQRMPGMTGVEFLRRAKDLYPHTLRLVLSGYTELQSIIDAVNEGAIYKFLTKPWDDERLRGHVAEAFRQKELADENRRLARQVDRANADLAKLNERLERTLGQQREQAELLAASAGSMREVFDELPVAALALDADGTLVFVNREAERLLPTLTANLGNPAAECLPPALLAPMTPGAPLRQHLPFAGRPWLAMSRLLPGPAAAQGRLLLLLPEESDPTP